jgi:hypothetical protein
MAFHADAALFTRGAVDAIAANHPLEFHLAGRTIALDLCQDAFRFECEANQTRRAVYLASVVVQIAGEDGFCDLLGYSKIETVDTAAGNEFESAKSFAVRVNLDRSLSAAGVQELAGEAHRFEYLERTGFDDGRAIPMERCGMSVDQMTRDAAPLKLAGEKQSGGSGADHKHRGGVAFAVCLHTVWTMERIRHLHLAHELSLFSLLRQKYIAMGAPRTISSGSRLHTSSFGGVVER